MFPLNLKNKNPLDYDTIIFNNGRTIKDYCIEVKNKIKGWDDIKKEFKEYVKEKLLENQDHKCAYCGGTLNETSLPEIEHIAPKKIYSEFIIERNNLVLSCNYCNNKKRGWDTIETRNDVYENCTFVIVHPYFDNPHDHYYFVTNEAGCEMLLIGKTPKGDITKDKLDFNSEQRILARYRNYKNREEPNEEFKKYQNTIIKRILDYKG